MKSLTILLIFLASLTLTACGGDDESRPMDDAATSMQEQTEAAEAEAATMMDEAQEQASQAAADAAEAAAQAGQEAMEEGAEMSEAAAAAGADAMDEAGEAADTAQDEAEKKAQEMMGE
jgi:hypothetical protein